MSSTLFRFAAAAQDGFNRVAYGKETATLKMAFYDCVDKLMGGSDVKNYKELPKLYEEYGARGFKILAFPCNQFGSQEPGTDEEITAFVKKFDENMMDKLIFFEKADINGAKTREVFSFLKPRLPNEDGTPDVRWNFGKFLVDHEGTPFKRYFPKTSPFEMKDDIEELLKKKGS